MDEILRLINELFKYDNLLLFLQIMGVLIVLSSISFIAVERLVRRNKNLYSKSVMRKALDLSCLSIAQGKDIEIRANIFMPENSGNGKLFLRFCSSNMIDDKDREIEFEKWQGGVGMAYGANEIILADLSIKEVMGGATWGLTPEQVEITEGLKSILCIPINHPNQEGEIIAIYSVDSRESIIDFLSEEKTLTIASEYASQMGELLLALEVI